MKSLLLRGCLRDDRLRSPCKRDETSCQRHVDREEEEEEENYATMKENENDENYHHALLLLLHRH